MPHIELPDNNGTFGVMGLRGAGDEHGYPLFGRAKIGSGTSSTLPAVTKAEASEIVGTKVSLSPAGFAAGDLCILYKLNGTYERCRIQSVGADYVVLMNQPQNQTPVGGPIFLVKVFETEEITIDGPLVQDDIVIPITARRVTMNVDFESTCHVILWAESFNVKPVFELLEVITL